MGEMTYFPPILYTNKINKDLGSRTKIIYLDYRLDRLDRLERLDRLDRLDRPNRLDRLDRRDRLEYI